MDKTRMPESKQIQGTCIRGKGPPSMEGDMMEKSLVIAGA